MNSLNHCSLGDSRAQAGQQTGSSEPTAQQWLTHAHVLTPISKKPDGTAHQQCQFFHGRALHRQDACVFHGDGFLPSQSIALAPGGCDPG